MLLRIHFSFSCGNCWASFLPVRRVLSDYLKEARTAQESRNSDRRQAERPIGFHILTEIPLILTDGLWNSSDWIVHPIWDDGPSWPFRFDWRDCDWFDTKGLWATATSRCRRIWSATSRASWKTAMPRSLKSRPAGLVGSGKSSWNSQTARLCSNYGLVHEITIQIMCI